SSRSPLGLPSRQELRPVSVKSSTVRTWVLLVVGLGAVVTAGALLFADEEPTPATAAEAIVPVLVRPVGQLERASYVALSGEVEAWRTASVGFLVPGLVAGVAVREGDVVTEGQLLASL